MELMKNSNEKGFFCLAVSEKIRIFASSNMNNSSFGS